MTDIATHESAALRTAEEPPVPAYLRERYAWAYLHPASLRILDHRLVVSRILWGH